MEEEESGQCFAKRVKEALHGLISAQLAEKEQRKGRKPMNVLGKRIRAEDNERGRRESLSPSSKILDGLLLGSGGKRSHMGGTVLGSGWGSAAPLERLSLGQYIGLDMTSFEILAHMTEGADWEEMGGDLDLWWPSRPGNGVATRDQWLVAEAEAALLLLHVSTDVTKLATCFWTLGKPLFDRITLAATGSPAEKLWLMAVVAVEESQWQAGLECPFGRVDELLSTEAVRMIRKEEAGRTNSLYHVRRASRMRDMQRVLRREILSMYRETCAALSDCTPERGSWKDILQSILADKAKSGAQRSDLLPALLQELPSLVLQDEHVCECVYSGMGGSIDRMGAALEAAVGGTAAPLQLPLGLAIMIDAFLTILRRDAGQLSSFVKRFQHLIQSFLVTVLSIGEECEEGVGTTRILITCNAVKSALASQQAAAIHEDYFLEALASLASVEIGRKLLFSRYLTTDHPIAPTPPKVVDIRSLDGLREGKVLEIVTPSAIAAFWLTCHVRARSASSYSLSSRRERTQHLEGILAFLEGYTAPLRGSDSSNGVADYLVSVLVVLANKSAGIGNAGADHFTVISSASGLCCWILALCPPHEWHDRGQELIPILLQLLQFSLTGASLSAVSTAEVSSRGSIDDYLQATCRIVCTLQSLVIQLRKSERVTPPPIMDTLTCGDIGQSIVDVMASHWRLFAQKIPALIDTRGAALAGTTVDLSTATVQKLSGSVLFLLFDMFGVRISRELRVSKILPEPPSASKKSRFQWGLWRAIHTLFLSTQAFVTTSKMVVEGLAYLLEEYQELSSYTHDGEELTRWLRTARDALKETEIADLQKRLLRLMGAMMYNDSCLVALLGEHRLILQMLRMLRNNNSLAVRRNAAIAIGVLFTQACCVSEDLSPAEQELFSARRLKGLEAAVATRTVSALIQFAVRPKYNKDGVVASNALEALSVLLWEVDQTTPDRELLQKCRKTLLREASSTTNGVLKVLKEGESLSHLGQEEASNALEQLAVVMTLLLPAWTEKNDAVNFAKVLVTMLEVAIESSKDNFVAVVDLGCASCSSPLLHAVLSRYAAISSVAEAAVTSAEEAASGTPSPAARHLLKRCKRFMVKLQ